MFFPLYSTHPSIIPFILFICYRLYIYICILSSTIDYHFVRCNSIFSQYSYVSSRIYTRCLYAYINICIYIWACLFSFCHCAETVICKWVFRIRDESPRLSLLLCHSITQRILMFFLYISNQFHRSFEISRNIGTISINIGTISRNIGTSRQRTTATDFITRLIFLKSPENYSHWLIEQNWSSRYPRLWSF